MSNQTLGYVTTGKIEATVTYLEMTAPPLHSKKPQDIENLNIVRMKNPTLPFYRFLYDQVGKTWNWTGRKLMPDNELAQKINDPHVEIFVLYFCGCPAGYIELGAENAGRDIEIVYFGIVPDFIGRGFGKYLLAWANWYVWTQKQPDRFWLHTCTLDSEHALPTYLNAGFVKYDEKKELVDLIAPVLIEQ